MPAICHWYTLGHAGIATHKRALANHHTGMQPFQIQVAQRPIQQLFPETSSLTIIEGAEEYCRETQSMIGIF
jgi:hypothetical protein